MSYSRKALGLLFCYARLMRAKASTAQMFTHRMFVFSNHKLFSNDIFPTTSNTISTEDKKLFNERVNTKVNQKNQGTQWLIYFR